MLRTLTKVSKEPMGFFGSQPLAPRCWRQEAVRTSMSRTSRPPDASNSTSGANVPMADVLMSCWCQLNWIWRDVWRWMCACLPSIACFWMASLWWRTAPLSGAKWNKAFKNLWLMYLFHTWCFLRDLWLWDTRCSCRWTMVRSHWKFVASSFGRC